MPTTHAATVLNALEALRVKLVSIPELPAPTLQTRQLHERMRLERLASIHEAVDGLLGNPTICADFYRLSMMREDLVPVERLEVACAEVDRLAANGVCHEMRALGETDAAGKSAYRATVARRRADRLRQLKARLEASSSET